MMDNTNSLIDDLAREGARKPLPGLLKQFALWMAGTALWMAVIMLQHGLRPDLGQKMAQPLYSIELILLSGAGISAALAALALSRPDDYQMPRLRFVPFVFMALWAITALTAMMPIAPMDTAQAFNPVNFDCVKCILALGLPPGLAMFFVVRLGAPVRSLWAGGLAIACAASFAYLAMRLVEPNDSPVHVLLWHALPVAFLCLTGMAAGKALLRWK